jgi:hypothetical protein
MPILELIIGWKMGTCVYPPFFEVRCVDAELCTRKTTKGVEKAAVNNYASIVLVVVRTMKM